LLSDGGIISHAPQNGAFFDFCLLRKRRAEVFVDMMAKLKDKALRTPPIWVLICSGSPVRRSRMGTGITKKSA